MAQLQQAPWYNHYKPLETNLKDFFCKLSTHDGVRGINGSVTLNLLRITIQEDRRILCDIREGHGWNPFQGIDFRYFLRSFRDIN